MARRHEIPTLVSMFTAFPIILACIAAMDSAPEFRQYWFVFFMFCNLGYLVYYYYRSPAERKDIDLSLILVILTGPVAFFTWTGLGVWYKYIRRKRNDS